MYRFGLIRRAVVSLLLWLREPRGLLAMLTIHWNVVARHALPLFLGRLRVLSLPRENPAFLRGILLPPWSR